MKFLTTHSTSHTGYYLSVHVNTIPAGLLVTSMHAQMKLPTMAAIIIGNTNWLTKVGIKSSTILLKYDILKYDIQFFVILSKICDMLNKNS